MNIKNEPQTIPQVDEKLPSQQPQQLNLDKYYENSNDPKNVIANLKRNPDIPDVKPPPLPLKQTNNDN